MGNFNMRLPDDVAFILGKIRESGHTAYVVGGSVRDSLLGRSLADFDITTSATPDETKAVFCDFKTVDTGIKHGTVSLVLNGVAYEITTYRVDGDYKDNRHPESVTFTDRLEDDLARRDFTVNAMAYNPSLGLCDPFDGKGDAERKLIRAVGDPYVRFDEDALRILRALRFASVLGFDIENKTAVAVCDLAGRLTSISRERIFTELKKLIMGVDAAEVLVKYSSVLEWILGGLKIEKIPDRSLFDKADIYSRFASLFLLNCDDPVELADRVFTDLKTDKFTRTHTVSVISAYNGVSFATQKDTLITLMRYGEEIAEGVLALGVLLGRFTDRERDTFTNALASGIPYKISGLTVRGTDLLRLGIKGERVGETLRGLLYAVINGEVENSKEDLLNYVKKV